MKKIHVIATSDGRILTISCNSDIPRLLQGDEKTKEEWFYEPPQGLHEFLHGHPQELKRFLEAFSYWIHEFQTRGFIEDIKRFKKFEEEVKKFSDNLLMKLRALASRIAKQVAKFLRPRHGIYDEYREKKLNKVKPGLGTKKLTRREKRTICELQRLRSEYQGLT